MIKNYILDTNVMIHDPLCFYKFEDNHIIIPIICVEELDHLKKREGIVGYHARSAARELSNIRKTGSLSEGVKLENGGTLRIELNHMDFTSLPDGLDYNKNDTKILAVAKKLQEIYEPTQTILVTKDLYMAIKGDAIGLDIQDYQNDKVETDDLYRGYMDTEMYSKDIDAIYAGGLNVPKELEKTLFPNEFLHIKSLDRDGHEILARYDGDKIVPLKYQSEVSWGLVPINREQKMAYELLLNPDIHFVTISGGAGSGKTILATAVALQKVIEQGQYRKVVFVRPVVPAGNDIGYLPGTEEEKLRPWMGSFYDAIESLVDQKVLKKQKETIGKGRHMVYSEKPEFSVDDFIEQYRRFGVIETKTFTYMRGRTLTDALVIVDEAQEITPHLAKLMLTRAGFGSKFVFIGDPSDNQIDNVLVDAKSNGLVYTIEKMKPYPLTGHVTLKQVERSPLAKIAEQSM
ncbi:PhoH family protein [Fusibacter bizertensis]|uniref:PhoH family protein n=1 Tax=Fusibacter bizertensis TaxID=1488331 RepID=A0ABT6N8G0_9FIRM|nr:PhoH family protein [Fusibacter bizertensis]MDH8676697.1 PhoH family protein [Fusibacter bizertensis]